MPFDGLWSRGENHRREVRRMMDSRLGQFTADESCNKLHEKVNFKKKNSKNKKVSNTKKS